MCFKVSGSAYLLGPVLVGKLLVEGKFNPFNVMAKFNGWAKFQVHTLLNCGKSEQEKCLPIYFLSKEKEEIAISIKRNVGFFQIIKTFQ